MIRVALAGLLLIGSALCALAQQGTGPIPTGTGNYGPTLGSIGAHSVLGGGLPPTINAACGTSPGVVFGTDSAFNFVTGTGSSATCTATFIVPWNNRPTCVLSSEGNTASYNVSRSAVVISGAVDNTRYHVHCDGQGGG